MDLTPEQIDELAAKCSAVSRCDEGGLTYLLLSDLELPPGCTPTRVDALFCAGARDGYNTRLFFAEKVSGPSGLNWLATGVRILERVWWVFSWKVPADRLRLAEVVAEHLRPMRQA